MKKQTLENENKTNNKIEKRIIKIVLIAILIFILLYFIYNICKLIQNPTDVFIVKEGTISLEENVYGYIIRDEVVLEGEKTQNEIIQIKNEGEKVAINEPVFRYSSSKEESLRNKINELNKKIDEALENEEKLPYTSDIEILDNEIKIKIDETYEESDVQKIKEYKKDIDSAINKKSKIAGSESKSGSYINDLINERAEYENEINASSEYINSSRSGVVSYRVDGLESTLVTGDLSYLSKRLLQGVDVKTGQIIATSPNQGKIINNFMCYIAVVMNSRYSEEAEVGDRVTLRLSSAEEVEAEIYYIAEETDGSRVIVFEINKHVEDLINYRKISLDVIWWSKTGLKIPNSAIIYEDDLTYVMRNRAGYLDKILVKVLRSNESYSLVENYEIDELKELGYTSEEIQNITRIKLYDEILENN